MFLNLKKIFVQVVRGFENLLPQNSIVIREGSEGNISADNLVVGDIIKIKSGTRVPADARKKNILK